MANTFAQLRAAASIATAPDPVAALKAARMTKKAVLYSNLNAIGVIGTASWTTGSVPSSLVEMYSWSLVDYDVNQAYVAEGLLNSTASGDALSALAYEVYDNVRALGKYTVARALLTDTAGAGPWTFTPSSVSFSVGRGGLLFNGIDLLNQGQITLPRGGTVYVYVRSEGTGAAYSQLSLGTLNFFARGALGGVTVSNDASWLSFDGAIAGTDDEPDATLQERNRTKWGTLGTGSPARAYVNLAMSSDPTSITRVKVLSNRDILEPGKVDVVVAGPAGAVAPSVVQGAQIAIAPLQIGGDKIPETARAVVSSAINRTISIAATVYVQKEYNTAAFYAQVSADYAAFAKATEIGGGPLGVVSAERLEEILSYRAGLSPAVIYDVKDFTPRDDVALAWNEVPIFSLNFTWIPV